MANSTTSKPTYVTTGKVRFNFCNVFKPREQENGGDPKYDICILIPKTDTETVKRIKKAIEAAKEIGKTSKWNGKIPPNLNNPLRDGDTERDTEEFPEYAGHWFVNASSLRKPTLVDINLDPITDSTEFYSGCYGRASINFYPFDSKGNKGVAAGLENLQKRKDGEPLGGGGRSAREDFDDDFEDDEDEL